MGTSGKYYKSRWESNNHYFRQIYFCRKWVETLVQNANDYTKQSNDIAIDTYYKELVQSRISNGSDGTDGTNTTARNLKRFVENTILNGGYYIARFEASYRDGIRPYSKVSVTATETATQTSGKLWNWINQQNAAKASIAMYQDASFETDLLNSYAWSTAISYIQKCSGDSDYSMQSSLNTTIGNTGKNGDERCKIQDMASNEREWCTETSSYVDSAHAAPCVSVGRDYTSPQGDTRYGSRATSSNKHISFRMILYF